jgi:hypothetical protein
VRALWLNHFLKDPIKKASLSLTGAMSYYLNCPKHPLKLYSSRYLRGKEKVSVSVITHDNQKNQIKQPTQKEAKQISK